MDITILVACVVLLVVMATDVAVILSKKKMLDSLDGRLKGVEARVDEGLRWMHLCEEHLRSIRDK